VSTLITPKQHGRKLAPPLLQKLLSIQNYTLCRLSWEIRKASGGACTPKTNEAKYLPDILPVLGFRSLPRDS